jgi:hypothetical protein
MMTDSSLQGNTQVRNSLQIAMGPKPKASSKNGMGAAQLRVMKKRQREEQEQAAARMPDEEVASRLGQKNERFVRNNLSKKKLKPREEISQAAHQSDHTLFPGFGQTLSGGSYSVKPAPSLKPAPSDKPATSDKPAPPHHLIVIDNSPKGAEETVEAKVNARKTKLRLAIGKEMMQARKSGDPLSPSARQLHSLLLKSTPQKSIDTSIGDAIDHGYDTPETRSYLKLTLGLDSP